MLSMNRANLMMQHGMVEQRSTVRTPVCISGTVSWRGNNELIALVRDVSDSGVFFYSNFAEKHYPDLGQDLTLNFAMDRGDKKVEMRCRGRVVRMVRFPTGAATGVAVKLDRAEVMPRMEV